MDVRREDGIALMVAMMAMLLMTALGAALVLTTASESIIAATFRNSGEGLYAADAALERMLDDLITAPDWNAVLGGAVQSSFVDGPPDGDRTLADGATIDLTQVLAMLNCGKSTPCTGADMDRVTRDRPWGANNPRWQLYGYGRLSDLMPTASVRSAYYVAVMVGDDPSELDGDPARDGMTSCQGTVPVRNGEDPPGWNCNPGTGVLEMRAEAFGPGGAYKVVEMTIARTSAANGQNSVAGEAQDYNNAEGRRGVRILSWRQVR